MFDLSTLLNTDRTDQRLQEELAKFRLDINEKMTEIFVVDIGIVVKLENNRTNLVKDGDWVVYSRPAHAQLVDRIEALQEIMSATPSLLVQRAVEQKVAGLVGRLMEMGARLENLLKV